MMTLFKANIMSYSKTKYTFRIFVDVGKNIFKIREKYFRNSKSADRSTPDSDFLEEMPKSGENLVL